MRVGNGAGFWGDNLDAPFLLARDGEIDFLTLEYLAELTMAILSHLRSRDAAAGFVTDFPELLERLAPLLKEQDGLRVVTNAGGLNPPSCAARCGAILEAAGLSEIPLGMVTGDDVLDRVAGGGSSRASISRIWRLANRSRPSLTGWSQRTFISERGGLLQALAGGARIVLTGRVADASLTLGPAVAHHGWGWDDWNSLAGASTAGHLIECGAQATGGLWHRWEQLADPAGIGYPIAEIEADGSCAITKPSGTGGLVSVNTVAEQLLYEIDDPSCYHTPDVDVDFTSLELSQAGQERVSVKGATGRPPSDRLKLVAVYRDGWTASGMVAVVGRNAEAKARAAGELVLERVRRAGVTLSASLVECLGAGDVAPGVLAPAAPPFEVVLRVTVRDAQRAAVERFCRELAPLVTAGPPGIVGYAAGRPAPRPAFGYWPALVPRAIAESRTRVEVRGASEWAKALRPSTKS